MNSPRSSASYRRIFEELYDSMRVSADAYDRGFNGEAKRLAVCMRVLFHDTKQSVSLFEQLKIKRKLSFVGSPNFNDPSNGISECDLTAIHLGNPNTYLPVLSDFPGGFGWTYLPFDSWWGEKVIRLPNKTTFTRKELILWLANKDGGAHVDPMLEERFQKLQEENSFGWKFSINGVETPPVSGVEVACVRQIAHEVFLSIERNRKVIVRSLS